MDAVIWYEAAYACHLIAIFLWGTEWKISRNDKELAVMLQNSYSGVWHTLDKRACLPKSMVLVGKDI